MIGIYKKIILIWFNFKKIYKVNKFLFILVIISTMISTFGIFFFADYFAGYFRSFINHTGDMLVIDLENSEISGSDLLHAIQELNENKMEDIICKQIDDYEQTEYNIMGEYHKNYNSRMQCGRLLEIDETLPNVVIDEWTAAAITSGNTLINQSIDINGQQYQVVGICSITDNDEIMLPVAYFLQNFKVSQVKITFSGKLSTPKRNEKESILKNYKIEKINWKSQEQPWSSVDFWVNFIQILGVFIIIGINIFVLIYYLLYRCRRNYCIYSICGGKDVEISSIIIGQIILHLFIGTILGTILNEVLCKIIGHVDWLYHGGFTFYLFLFLMIMLIHIMIACILERKLNKKLEIYQVEE